MTSLINLAVLKILESISAKADPKLKLGMKSAVVQSDPIVRDLLKKGVKRKRNEIGNTKNLYKHTYLNAGKTKKNFLKKAHHVRNVYLISIPNKRLIKFSGYFSSFSILLVTLEIRCHIC